MTCHPLSLLLHPLGCQFLKRAVTLELLRLNLSRMSTVHMFVSGGFFWIHYVRL